MDTNGFMLNIQFCSPYFQVIILRMQLKPDFLIQNILLQLTQTRLKLIIINILRFYIDHCYYKTICHFDTIYSRLSFRLKAVPSIIKDYTLINKKGVR